MTVFRPCWGHPGPGAALVQGNGPRVECFHSRRHFEIETLIRAALRELDKRQKQAA